MALEPPEMHKQLRRLYHESGTGIPLPGDAEGWRDFMTGEKKMTEKTGFGDLQEVFDYILERREQGLASNVTFDLPGFKETALIPAPEPPESALPEGTHILPVAKRIGDESRDKTIEQLRQAHAEGYISQDETLARIDAAMNAQVAEDLSLLVRDLELLTPQKNISVPAPSLPVKKHHWNFGLINTGVSMLAMGAAFNLAYTTSDATAQGQGIIAACSLVFLFFFVQLTRAVIEMIRKS